MFVDQGERSSASDSRLDLNPMPKVMQAAAAAHLPFYPKYPRPRICIARYRFHGASHIWW